MRDLEASDPLPPTVAAATVKRYLAEDRYRIRLNDLVGEAVRETVRGFDFQKFALAQQFTPSEFLRRMKIYEAGTEVLRHMIAPLCQWGDVRHEALAVKILEVASDFLLLNHGASTDVWKQLSLYPSLLLLYAGGVSALSAENYGIFAALLTRPRYRDDNGERPLLLECCPPRVLRADLKQFLPGYENRYTPASDYLLDRVRPLMETSLPREHRYADCFDRFEYLMALVYANLREKSRQETSSNDFWGPIGRFGWSQRGRTEDILQVVADEISKFGVNWAPLKAGLFDGSLARVNAVKAGLDSVVAKVRLTYF